MVKLGLVNHSVPSLLLLWHKLTQIFQKDLDTSLVNEIKAKLGNIRVDRVVGTFSRLRKKN